MVGRKKLLLWTLAGVIWFFLHTVLLLLVLSGVSKNQEFENPRNSKIIHARDVRGHPGLRLMTSQQTPSMKTVKGTTRTTTEPKRFTPHYYPTTEVPPMLTLDPLKMTRLKQSLNHIMTTHQRPDDDYYGFNVTRSEEIPFDRNISDNRFRKCKDIEYEYDALPTLSVVTPVHNEALSTLVRHVVAILLRTPDNLLKDIILVDDNSTFSYLGKDLDEFFDILDSRVKIIRNKEREGLVKSRIHGSDIARGEVVVFLDAHMEVGHGWSEPLLHRLNSQSAIVVQPDVPSIDGETFEMETSRSVVFRGGFGWDMRYAWFFIPPYIKQFLTSETDPIPTPVLVGCAIAVRREYFNSIGKFDPGLQIWGGEHFDLSFRVWTSGGRVETVPCSKVGHVFKSNKYSYGPKGKQFILSKNLLRVALIWMDGYQDIVKATTRDLNGKLPVYTEEELKSIEERRQLKRDLKCKDFTWFLKHIMPEVKVPSPEAVYFGEVTNEKSGGCFFMTESGHVGITYVCFRFRIVPENTFTIDKYGRLLYENKCIGVDEHNWLLRVTDCPCVKKGPLDFRWEMIHGRIIFVTPQKRICATHVTSVTREHKGEQMVQALQCQPDNNHQKWHFMYHFEF